ncbi:uncharacterized protein LOC117342765 [Pecten maximus]|uniref:uncharacterized protein LOC117342765 n=1 Tax=Pecten maximus TaxID=6579 RepID=UPI001458642C|nr:uncharacterized protein LOC117342765 [Pecten maximus]
MAAAVNCPQWVSKKLPTDNLTKNTIEEKDVLCAKTSGVLLKTPSGELVQAGFKLMQCESGFRIVELDPDNAIVSNLQLMQNDKLLAINNVDVSHWEHHVVEDFIKHMFDPDQSRMTMVVERQELANGETATVEIVVDYYVSRGNGSRIVSCIRRMDPFSNLNVVYCVEFTGSDVCLISIDTMISQLYLKCEADGRLTMSNLSSRTDTAYHFKRTLFHGFVKKNNENNSCFPCVLQSVYLGKYLSVQSCSTVGLSTKTESNDLTSMTSLRKTDSRFFLLKLKKIGQQNEYVLESSILQNKYLTWDITKEKMKLASSAKSAGLISTNSTFHMYAQ